MATRLGWMLMAAVLAAVPAVAQPWDNGLEPDSLGMAADAELLQMGTAETECDPIGFRVVANSADARRLERFPRCGPGAFPALGRRLYVRVPLIGDCHATHEVHAYRSATRREYRVVVTDWYGGCRAGRYDARWILLPPLPDGWTVTFSEFTANRHMGEWQADTLGLAADGVPLDIQEEWTVGCDPRGVRMLRDSADAHGIQGLPGCQPSAFPALGRALYVRVVSGTCGGRAAVHAYRSESRREYRVMTFNRSRNCAARDSVRWFRLPPLPPGWTVAFTDMAL